MTSQLQTSVMTTIKWRLIRLVYNTLRPRGKYAFLKRLRLGGKIFDVGCGNDSSYRTKSMFPHVHYTGIDVGDYFQTKPQLADEYIITTPEQFAAAIAKFEGCFDAVISSHNIEHCDDREATMTAMLGSLRSGGRIYLAFPTEGSVRFPRGRVGTLNYFDDDTHKAGPPKFDEIVAMLERGNFKIQYKARNYRPLVLRLLGTLLEPLSRTRGRVFPGTWEYYGFESIIWAKKR